MILNKDSWNLIDYDEFLNYLHNLSEEKYKNFHNKLLPNNNNLIGIRTPILKKIAKEISQGNYIGFLSYNKHKYYEECILHGFIIANLKLPIKDIINYINNFLPYIDNWATCDLFCASLKIINKNKDEFFYYIKTLITNNDEWIRRFCFVILLDYYIEPNYLPAIFEMCNDFNNDKYYVNMAIAWLISICYIKYKDITLNYLKDNKLDNFTYNKSIQKIIESTRIDKDEKKELKLLKR